MPASKYCCCCDGTTLKLARKPVMLQKENPAGCAGGGKQSKGNQEKRKGRFILFSFEFTKLNFEFNFDITKLNFVMKSREEGERV